ncbi:hypothetical protein CFOL_v3_27517, partial [Cephalotus follicularis]
KEELERNYKHEFAMLWDYAAEIRSTNPGSTTVMEVDRVTKDAPPVFKRFYVCFEACKRGWLGGCRPVIGSDRCFLKGLCKGILFCGERWEQSNVPNSLGSC